ncbi:MAG: hypothetical protein AB7O24_08790 [Kofleriaceae bacterium]
MFPTPAAIHLMVEPVLACIVAATMMPRTWYVMIAVCLALHACDGGKADPKDGGVDDPDAAVDLPADAAPPPPPQFYDCPATGAPPTCNPTTGPVSGPASGTTCNALTHAGCEADEKCTWLNDQDNPPIGHLGCAPTGTVQVGCACTEGPAGPNGYDDCERGAYCQGGICRRVCDIQGGSPTCESGFSCVGYADQFEVGGTRVAGICDPSCDPLTQCMGGPSPNACGSPNGAQPTKGCYGYDEFSCAPTGMTTWPLTDRAMPRTNSSGQAFLNGCAPGFMPLFYEMTGSMTTLCSGLCSALDTDNTPSLAGNSKGDPLVYGKLPGDAKPTKGHATCGAGIKGSEASSTCRFIWQYVQDDAGMLLPSFEAQYADKLGVCMAIAHFKYDSDGDMAPETPYPDCSALPPPDAGTNGSFDDANDWACYSWTKTNALSFTNQVQPRNPVRGAIRVGKMAGELPLRAHVLE